MRPSALTALVLIAPLAGGCMTTRSDGSGQVQTTGEANRESLEGAAAAPLRDLNLLRTKVPDILLQAMADPYQRPASTKCQALVTALHPPNAALGADLDVPSVDEDDLLDKGREGALGAVAQVTGDVIPFRGWVRKLSGAERHDRLVQAAITAGAVRRAYLKGLGEARGCSPPATPSHELAGTPVIRQGFRPRYPVRSEPAPESGPGPGPGPAPGTGPAAPPR